MRLSFGIVAISLVAFANAQTVSRPAAAVKGASPYTITLISPWKSAPVTKDPNKRALIGDFLGPKNASLTVVAFAKNAPKRFQRFDPRNMKLITDKKAPSRSGTVAGYKYLAYWLAGDHLSTVGINMKQGQKVISVTAIWTRKASKKEMETVIKIGLSSRV